MSLIIPPGYGSAAFIFTSTTGTPPIVTTLGLDLLEVGGDYVAAADKCFAAYEAHLLPETDTSLTLDRVTLSVGPTPGGGSVDSTLDPSPGTRSGTGPPVSMAVIVRKVTDTLGRRGRGRFFLPGLLTTTNVDENGIIDSGRREQIRAACGVFLASVAAATEPPGLMKPVLLHSSAPSTPNEIVDIAVSSQVGWIRGRIR